jgi:hypothetical protein
MHLSRAQVTFSVFAAAAGCAPIWAPEFQRAFDHIFDCYGEMAPDADQDMVFRETLRRAQALAHQAATRWLDAERWEREGFNTIISHYVIKQRIECTLELFNRGLQLMSSDDELDATVMYTVLVHTLKQMSVNHIDLHISTGLSAAGHIVPTHGDLLRKSVTMAA